MDNEIFALDIGTRKVMGIVCRRTEEGIEIIDSETLEHPSRADAGRPDPKHRRCR